MQYIEEVQKVCTNGVSFSFPERKKLLADQRLEFEDEFDEYEVPAVSDDSEEDWDESAVHDSEKAAATARNEEHRVQQMDRIQRLIAKERERLKDMLEKMMEFFEDNKIKYLAKTCNGFSYDYHPDQMNLQNTDFYKKDERKCESDASAAKPGRDTEGKAKETATSSSSSSGKKHLTPDNSSCSTEVPKRLNPSSDTTVPVRHNTIATESSADHADGQAGGAETICTAAITSQPAGKSSSVVDSSKRPHDAHAGAQLETCDSLSSEKKKRKSNECIDYEALCNSDMEEDESGDDEYDQNDLHYGRANDPQPAYNMESHGAEDWAEWLPLVRSKDMLYKHVAKEASGGSEQAFICLESNAIKRLSVRIQVKNKSLDRPKDRIKINDFYLRDDVGNVLAQEILDTLGDKFEVVAPKSAAKEVPYKFIGCMEKLSAGATIKKWKEEIRQILVSHRNQVNLPAAAAARKQVLEMEIATLNSLSYTYKV